MQRNGLLKLIILLGLLTKVISFTTTYQPKHACLDTYVEKNRYPKCENDTKTCETEECASHLPNCHAVYVYKYDDLKRSFLTCWDDIENECSNNTCNLKYNAKEDVFDCCCFGYLCNKNVVIPADWRIQRRKTTTKLIPTVKPDSKYSRYTLYYIPASLFVSFVLIGVAIYLFLKRKRHRAMHGYLLSVQASTVPSTPIQTTPVHLLDVLQKGKMSCVWKSFYLQRVVAIKVIQHQNYQLWTTEKDMFEKHNLRHENLLNFMCAEKRRHQDDTMQYWIITEYHEHGSLADYLQAFTITSNDLLRMLFSIIKGLVYLHSGDTASGRPMVAHRDVKSGNILVKKDLTCCIGDLGLALALPDSVEICYDLYQAGTKRYMAPEVLQGAITFHRESFLRIDMYAMGLVIWELFSRAQIITNDIHGVYRQPYADIVGYHPTIDDMLKCVVENKNRPYIHPGWRETQTLDILCQTMERCWDDDGDARLTVQCVHERLKQLIYHPPDNTYELSFLDELKAVKEDSCESSSGSSTNNSHQALFSCKSSSSSNSSHSALVSNSYKNLQDEKSDTYLIVDLATDCV